MKPYKITVTIFNNDNQLAKDLVWPIEIISLEVEIGYETHNLRQEPIDIQLDSVKVLSTETPDGISILEGKTQDYVGYFLDDDELVAHCREDYHRELGKAIERCAAIYWEETNGQR